MYTWLACVAVFFNPDFIVCYAMGRTVYVALYCVVHWSGVYSVLRTLLCTGVKLLLFHEY